MVLGILTVLLGFFAISAPLFIGIAVLYFIGASMMVGGIFQIIHSIQGNGNRAFAILSGLLAIVCGGVIFSKPLLGLGVITLFLIAYFIADGIVKIIHALKHRRVEKHSLTQEPAIHLAERRFFHYSRELFADTGDLLANDLVGAIFGQ